VRPIPADAPAADPFSGPSRRVDDTTIARYPAAIGAAAAAARAQAAPAAAWPPRHRAGRAGL